MNKRSELLAVINQLGEQEIEVLLYQAWRLHVGQTNYGQLDLSNDTRDFLMEMYDEVSDEANYDAMGRLKALMARKKQK